jgi:hypothetical protein
MKTKTLFIFIFTIVSLCVQAQSFYVRAGLGAAISTSPRISTQFTTFGDSAFFYQTDDSKRICLANGVPIVAAAGYYFGNNFGIELGVDYFAGFNVKPFDEFYESATTSKGRGSMLSIVPAFVVRINNDKLKPYARLGIIIGVLNKVLDFETSDLSSNSSETTSKIYGGIAVGAQAALGAELPLNDFISLFGEVNLDEISWAPTKGKYLKDTYNGVDLLPNMTTKEKTWIYVKNLDTSQTIPDSDPNKNTLVNYSFSNVGLIVGVKLNLGK